MKESLVCAMDELPGDISFLMPDVTHGDFGAPGPTHLQFSATPPTFDEYCRAFQKVQDEILLGNSYLLNLTFKSKIETNLDLSTIFHLSKAKYKLLLKDRLVVFSPETFVQIKDGLISSFPMKGTLDASIPNATEVLLNDEKESAEHNTIVDLIRNDLAMVSEDVFVEKFKYIEKLKTHKSELLQMSSKVSGKLPADFRKHLGDIILRLLPAGSISGAPKPKTIQIIKEAESYDRGFYTGIFGFFDGRNMDSAVMIRFIEKEGDSLFFKSGGGITAMSEVKKEYEELIQKIYVPIT